MKRIVQDIDCVVDIAYLRIFESLGIVVPHLRTRLSHQNDLTIGQLTQGGWKTKTRISQKMDPS